jgi:hypothetical protein
MTLPRACSPACLTWGDGCAWRDRQWLSSTPLDTPRRTVNKTSVVDTLYVDLVEQ